MCKAIVAYILRTQWVKPSLSCIMSSGAERKSLQDMSETTIVMSLGQQARSIASRFCCGGMLSLEDDVKLAFEKSGDERSCVTFPVSDHKYLQELLDVCSAASFGLGEKQVTDKSYRDALKLEPERFQTSLQLCNTQLLVELQNIMMPDMYPNIQYVRAELYKLNIYSGPGGHFKSHVDTPRSSEMFGSLVVCLPTQFTGGELVTRHKGKEIRFDWSSTPQSPMKKVSWAAFFSDVEHEVLPVTDGHRCTLTYNLYCVRRKLQDLQHTVNIISSPFYRELRAAVSNPHFMRAGGILGFSCQYQYVFTDLNARILLPCLLKGADNVVYMAAMALSLCVRVKPVALLGSSKWSPGLDSYLLPHFTKFMPTDYYFDFENTDINDDEVVKELFGREVTRTEEEGITWCQIATNFEPAATHTRYGNDASNECAYQAACILVDVPEWGAKRQGL